MRFKILGVLAAVALVSACSTDGEDEMSNASSGDSTTTSSSTTSSDSSAADTATVMENPIVPGSQRDLIVNAGILVHFSYDRSDLNDLGRGTLESQAAWLQQNPSVRIMIEGHCDERGTFDYNFALGTRRATASKDYLVSLGVQASRISIISYADERPAKEGSNEDAWKQNRRSVTIVQ